MVKRANLFILYLFFVIQKRNVMNLLFGFNFNYEFHFSSQIISRRKLYSPLKDSVIVGGLSGKDEKFTAPNFIKMCV